MNTTIVKFGGSNLKSSSDIQNIINIVRSYPNSIIIVVSAFFGVTDDLQKLLDITSSKSDEVQLINKIFYNYESICTDQLNKSKQKEKFAKVLKKRKNILHDLLVEHKKNNKSIVLHNSVLSFGERLSSFCLSFILNANQINSHESLPETIGLVSNNNLQNATVSLNSDFSLLKSKLTKNKTIIVPGFYAKTKSGQTSIFGRGGSDYTAAILAYAFNAKSLDLWKDVSGFLSADPKIINQVEKIDSLTYLEAAELSYFGAKIIHPGTIRPLIKAQIPLNILDINATSINKSSSTKINGNICISKKIIKSITYSNNFILLKLKGSGVGIKKGILSEITKAFDLANINIRTVITSLIEIDFLIHEKDIETAFSIAKELQNQFYDIEVDKDIALIAAIGHGIKQSPGISSLLFGAVAEKNINIKNIVFGASEVSIYLMLSKEDLKPAIQNIHHKIINN